VLENRMLSRIYGPRRDEVTVSWRKLRNKELHNLYSSPIIIRIIDCSTNGEKINAYRIMVVKPEEQGTIRRPRRRWMDDIKMELRMWY
jgi:hypothetical protein